MPRRSRAFRRFHTDRVIAKRVHQARLLAWWIEDPDWEPVRGRLDDEQHYIVRVRIRWLGERTREKREWRRLEGLD